MKKEDFSNNTMQKSSLADVADNLPGGICEMLVDDCYTLCYANQCFYETCGYSADEMRLEHDSAYSKIVFPADLSKLQAVLNDTLQNNMHSFESEHRILHKNGRVQWVLLRGRFGFRNGSRCVYCIIIDMTSRREVEEALRINEERFRIALAQTDNTIFDYDIKARRMLHGDKSAETYGLDVYTENVPDSLVESGVVHQDTALVFFEMYDKICKGEPSASCDIKARLVSGEYAWRKITMTNVFDTAGNAVRAVGYLEDIDDQKKREQDLLHRSELDALTGIYNKKATELRITACLKENPSLLSAFFMLDLDNFKHVNDSYGHLFGDRVLEESARRIRSLFREMDIIGRVGGDEFVVLMCNIPDIQKLEQRAQKLCSIFAREFIFGDICAALSCSVGISVVPQDGTDFCELYQKADISLYRAKSYGKNRFHIFDPSLDSAANIRPHY